MTVTEPDTTDADEASPVVAAEGADEPVDEVVEEDVLVEEISIDGMCGVY